MPQHYLSHSQVEWCRPWQWIKATVNLICTSKHMAVFPIWVSQPRTVKRLLFIACSHTHTNTKLMVMNCTTDFFCRNFQHNGHIVHEVQSLTLGEGWTGFYLEWWKHCSKKNLLSIILEVRVILIVTFMYRCITWLLLFMHISFIWCHKCAHLQKHWHMHVEQYKHNVVRAPCHMRCHF